MKTHRLVTDRRPGFDVRLRIAAGSALAAFVLVCGAARAHAQVAEDAGIRAWLDTTFYTGTPGRGPNRGPTTTVIAPVLQADIKMLGLLRLGLDLPFAAGFTSSDARGIGFGTLTGGSDLNNLTSGSQFNLGNPTLHGEVEIEAGPLMARAGLGIAVSVRNDDIKSVDDLAGASAMLLGAATRGMWNAWWYSDTHAVYAPGEVAYRGDNYALGVEGALILFVPRSDTGGTSQTALQLGPYIAAITGKTSATGLRWRNFIGFSNDVLRGDHLQSSLEAYAEVRVMELLLLGGGVLVNLDKPFGVFGDGAGIWGVRLKAGLAL